MHRRSRLRPAAFVLLGLGFACAVLRLSGVVPLSAENDAPPAEPKVRMAFFNDTWESVLDRIATETESTLVVHDLPPGRFSRFDHEAYTRKEAVRIVNRELEPEGFRVLEKGRFLVVLHDDRMRPRYPAPEMPDDPEPIRRTSATDEPLPDDSTAPEAAVSRPGASARPAAPVHTAEHAVETPKVFAASVPVVLARARVTPVAKAVHEVFGERSRLESTGPNGLPSFRVAFPRSDAEGDADSLVVEIDVPGNRLIATGPKLETKAAVELFRRIDAATTAGLSARLLPADSPAATIARKVNPLRTALAGHARAAADRQLAQAGQPQPLPEVQPQPQGQPQPQPEPEPQPEPRPPVDPRLQPQPQPGPGPGERDPRLPPGPIGPDDLPGIIGNIKGDVTLEALADLNVLVIRGNEADIEEVMKVVRQIELLSRGTTPDILLLRLQNVDSVALAELLNAVYEQLDSQRTREGDRRTVNVIPVVRPNAVLIIAPEAMLESVQDLAEQLDEPVDPRSEVQIFRLRSAVPAQVVALVEDFYADREGLGTRVEIAADARTNSVIVMARPNDLVEIERLIEGIDRRGSRAVNRVQIIPLRNAIAEELATVLTEAIDSVLGGGAAGAAGGEFAAAKSIVLEMLAVDGPDERRIRSGLLADVRIAPEPRTNSLLVTAPPGSLPLVEALIAQLDLPSPTVAEIKFFALESADATATAELLTELFAQDDAGAAEGALGVQLAGANDAASGLVPLRFSVDIRTNSVVAIGGADALDIVHAIILRLDGTDARQRQNVVFKLQNSPATEVALALNTFLTSQRELAAIDPELVSNVELLEREIIVVAEPITNSLLVSATAGYYEELRRIVAQLDAPPRQVVIQALIVEVELDNTDEFGVELGFQDSTLFDRSITLAEDLLTIPITNTAPNGVQTTTQQIISQPTQPGFLFGNPNTPLGNNALGFGADPSAVGTQGLSNFSLGRVNGDLGYGGLVFSASSNSVSVLLRALSARRNVHILSRPQIRTLDNLLAQIQVGQEVPIISDIIIDDTTGRITPVLTPDDAGIILTVTPRIRDDGEVVMEVIAEKSQFDFGAGPPVFTDPTTGVSTNSTIKDITTAQTTVAVPDGQTVVIGGMITKTDVTLARKVPLLGDIPFLGNLFRYDATTTARTELLIFLTPRVIDTHADAELIKQVEAGRMHYLEEEAEAIHGPLFAVPKVPRALEIEEVFPADDYGMQPPFPLPAPAPGSWEEGDVPTTRIPPQPTLRQPVVPLPAGPLLPDDRGSMRPGPAMRE